MPRPPAGAPSRRCPVSRSQAVPARSPAGIGEGDPLLYIRRISYDVSDVPREFVTSYYRADLYRLEIELGI